MRPVALLVLALLPPASLAQDATPRTDLPPIMRRAIEAFPKLRYTGTRILEFRQGPDRVRHTEQVIRDGERSRVEFPPGSPFTGQIIVEVRGKRMHFFPDRKEIQVMPARRGQAFERIFRFLDSRRGPKFRVTQAPGQVVAGMKTEQAIVTDPNGNVHQRLYVEPRSGLVLKREMFDRVGTPMGSYEFTQVNLNPKIDPREFQIRVRGATWVMPEDLARRVAADNGFLPAVLAKAPGLQLEHSRMVRAGPTPAFAQMYSGPGGRVSLFQLKGRVETERLRALARGEATVFAWQYKGSTFVLIGERPAEELQRLSKRLVER